MRVGMRERQHVRPDEDAEEDLDHHLGNRQEAAGSLGDDRSEHRGDADEDQGGNGVFDHASSARLLTAYGWHPIATSWRTRYARRPCKRVMSPTRCRVDCPIAVGKHGPA